MYILSYKTENNKKCPTYKKYNDIIVIGSWGITISISSLLFMWAGYKIDLFLNTEPSFMIGLLFLGIFLCVGRLFKDTINKIRG